MTGNSCRKAAAQTCRIFDTLLMTAPFSAQIEAISSR